MNIPSNSRAGRAIKAYSIVVVVLIGLILLVGFLRRFDAGVRLDADVNSIRSGMAEAPGFYLPLEIYSIMLSDRWELIRTGGGGKFTPFNLEKLSAPRPPPWFFGESNSFSIEILLINPKLHDAILKALSEIASSPNTPRGDVIKQLGKDLDGCWRYRINDFVLVYFPNAKDGNVKLLGFVKRSLIEKD